jgi:hypothetical protein
VKGVIPNLGVCRTIIAVGFRAVCLLPTASCAEHSYDLLKISSRWNTAKLQSASLTKRNSPVRGCNRNGVVGEDDCTPFIGVQCFKQESDGGGQAYFPARAVANRLRTTTAVGFRAGLAHTPLSWRRREQLYVPLNLPRFAFVMTRIRLKKTLRVCPQAPLVCYAKYRRNYSKNIRFIRAEVLISRPLGRGSSL